MNYLQFSDLPQNYNDIVFKNKTAVIFYRIIINIILQDTLHSSCAWSYLQFLIHVLCWKIDSNCVFNENTSDLSTHHLFGSRCRADGEVLAIAFFEVDVMAFVRVSVKAGGIWVGITELRVALPFESDLFE